MVTREQVVNELVRRGYRAELLKNVKNNVELNGLIIKNESNIAPIIYIDILLEDLNARGCSPEEAVEAVLLINKKHETIPFDMTKLLTEEYILSHSYVGLKRNSTEDVLKKESKFEDLEAYMFVEGYAENVGSFTFNVKPHLLEEVHIKEDDLWDRAFFNTLNVARAAHISEYMFHWIPEEVYAKKFGEEELEMLKSVPMFVVHSMIGSKGAGAIYNKRILKMIAEACECEKLIIIPATNDEVLVAAYYDECDVCNYNETVRKFIQNMVPEEDRLSDQVYIMKLK